MLALQMGTSTLIGCETNPLGGVTTKLPQRGHASPVAVSIAYAVTSAVATSPGFSVRWCAALAGRRGVAAVTVTVEAGAAEVVRAAAQMRGPLGDFLEPVLTSSPDHLPFWAVSMC